MPASKRPTKSGTAAAEPKVSELKRTKANRQADLLKALAAGATWAEACKHAGVCERTIRLWAAADPDFHEQIDLARSSAIGKIEVMAYELALNPNPKHDALRMFVLKCRAPEVWNDKANDQPSIVVAPTMTPDKVAHVFGQARDPAEPGGN